MSVAAILGALGLAAWGVVDLGRRHDLAERLTPYEAASLPDGSGPIDDVLAKLGSRVFQRRCAACHTIHGAPRVGPNLAGVTLRRDAAWIRAMILRPDSMTRADPVARALKDAYRVQMGVSGPIEPVEARAVLEFLRRVDAGGTATGAPR